MLYIFITGPIYNLIDVVPSDSREALSVPMQQIARVSVLYKDELSEQDRTIINEIIPADIESLYIPEISDPIKSNFQTQVLKSDLNKYIKLWVSLGLRYPDAYIDSFLYMTCSYWYPEMDLPHWGILLPWVDENYNNLRGPLNLYEDSKIPFYYEHLKNMALYATYQDIPVVSMLQSSGFCFFILLLCIAYLIYKRKYRLIIVTINIMGLFATVLLGPVFSVRYAYPLIICIPFVYLLIFHTDNRLK